MGNRRKAITLSGQTFQPPSHHPPARTSVEFVIQAMLFAFALGFIFNSLLVRLS